MTPVEVSLVHGSNLWKTLRVLEEWLREGEPVPESFMKEIRRHVEAGDLEILAASLEGRVVGVLVLAFRPNVSLGAPFASIEDLYVQPEARGQGAGGALLRAADERCGNRSVSYLEAQVEEEAANAFYAASGYEPEPGVRVLSRSLPTGEPESREADG